MKITYYGQSGFLVETNGHSILFDPFISGNPLAKDKINVDEVKCDHLLLTHGHQDHVLDAESILKRTKAKLISNFEIVSWYGEKGIENNHPMNHGGKISTDFGSVKYVNAIHSSTLPDGSSGGNPGGFVIEGEKNFYHAGDTALTMDMKLIPMTCKPLDFCMLPIGDCFTMGVDDAIIASDFVECNKVIGMHYDTFGYIEIDKEEAKKKFAAKGKELILMEIGETIEL